MGGQLPSQYLQNDTSPVTAALREHLHRVYTEARPRSKAAHESGNKVLPGGDTRSAVTYAPFPTYIERGEGCRVFDRDGHEYIDFLNNYTSLVLGHCHPRVMSAIGSQLKKGTAFAAPTELQVQLAELICSRMPSIERIRFCNSGTEATLHAVRTARIHTGKRTIIQMIGGYHGSLSPVEIETLPRLANPGADGSEGVLRVVDAAVSVPFNDAQAFLNAVDLCGSDLAAVIVEPMMGSAGAIPAKRSYLQELREVTKDKNAILIFDEVQTFRLSEGGAQRIYDIEPDLTCLGKVIGGGLPVGAFGGREEIMRIFSPVESWHVSHSGTFNGNPLTMVAGIATLEEFSKSVIDGLNNLGAYLTLQLEHAFEKAAVRVALTGLGSIFNFHLVSEPVVDDALARRSNTVLVQLLHLLLIQRGFLVAPRGMVCLSVPMTEREVRAMGNATYEALMALRPAIEELSPSLLTR